MLYTHYCFVGAGASACALCSLGTYAGVTGAYDYLNTEIFLKSLAFHASSHLSHVRAGASGCALCGPGSYAGATGACECLSAARGLTRLAFNASMIIFSMCGQARRPACSVTGDPTPAWPVCESV